jgi:membrane dipeptidase
VVKVAGIDHVGIGADLDGGGGVKGMFDVSEMGNVTAELLRRGYSARDIEKIWSGNLFRVMRAVEKTAAAAR